LDIGVLIILMMHIGTCHVSAYYLQNN